MNLDASASTPRAGRRADRLWGVLQSPDTQPKTEPARERWQNTPQARRGQPTLRRNQLRSIVAQADGHAAEDHNFIRESATPNPSPDFFRKRDLSSVPAPSSTPGKRRRPDIPTPLY